MIGRIFLGRYEAQKLLGEGGMGKVYLARQIDLARPVVVKVMHDHIATDPKFRERFQRETILMARFQHPSAVTLYDASLTDSFGPCIVMEYVKGVNLESILQKNGRLSPGRVGRVVKQLCEVLQAAHDEGIIHRDLKPANIMISEPDTPKERVKVMDFGLAKLIEDAHAQKVTDTAIDFAVGTPGYICPEQVRGEAMDHRGDLYSVGAMLFELLSGRLPFQGANSMDVLLAHATEDPPTFADLGLAGLIPRALEELLVQCLAKDPAKRPQTARELAVRYLAAVTQPDRSTPTQEPGSKIRSAVIDDSSLIIMLTASPETRPGAKSFELDPMPTLPTMPEMRMHASPGAATLSPPRAVEYHTPNPDSSKHQPSTSSPTPLPNAGMVLDGKTLAYQLEAWMPESIAVVKLRGFVHDSGGDVLESVTGLIRVRFSKHHDASGGPLSWFGFTRKSDAPIEMELQLNRVDPNKMNQLRIVVLFRPTTSQGLNDQKWRDRCNSIFLRLRAFVMG